MNISGINRFSLWFILVILTVTLLIFPTHLTLEYTAVQSVRIFDNIGLFAFLYCVWLTTLILLLLSRHTGKENSYEKIILVCIFSIVYLGFWVIVTRLVLSHEGLYNSAHIKYINSFGHISLGIPTLGYFDFPALHLLGSFFSQVSGLSPINSANVIVFYQAVLLATILFILFRSFLKNYLFASVAVMLVIQGSITLDKCNIFHPRNLGLIMLALFLILLNLKSGKLFKDLEYGIMTLIVCLAASTTHAVTSFLLFGILLGVYLVNIWHREPSEDIYSIIFFIVVPLTWTMNWAFITFKTVVSPLPRVFSEYLHGDIFWYLTMMEQSNVGRNIPTWASLTRAFWWIFIYGLGSVLWLYDLFHFKKLSTREKRWTGILFGIAIISIISVLASVGGGRFDTYLLYGAFALVPIILLFILSRNITIQRYFFATLIPVLLIMSFPSFLAHNNMIEYDTYYPDESASGNFLEAHYSSSYNLNLYGVAWLPLSTNYYVPKSTYTLARGVTDVNDENSLWIEFDTIIKKFESSNKNTSIISVFIWSNRVELPYEHFLGITPDNPKWQSFKNQLLNHNYVYDNRNTQMFLLRGN